MLGDSVPVIQVTDAEYARLLGYPRDWVLEGRPRELADWARAWYAAHGRPWIYVRHARTLDLGGDGVVVDGEAFSSGGLKSVLRQADAYNVVLAAVSAGPELEVEAQRLWHDDRPDEYFFLEVYGSAVVEQLTTLAGAKLCHWAEERGAAVLPHASPGYSDWSVGEQSRLLDLITRDGESLPGPLDALDSGMLRPKKSLLAVFGLAKDSGRVRQMSELVPCARCSFPNCQYRRASYHRPPLFAQHELLPASDRHEAKRERAIEPLNLDARYAVNARALDRWSRERLSLLRQPNGTTEALFRYEGATCTNMGRPLMFDYTVKLGLRDAGYPIQEQRCSPASGHDGFTYMCRYIDDRDNLMRAIDHEKPLLGRRLDEVLTWRWSSCSTSCYCDAPSRTHKWGLVLETIHYALARQVRVSRASAGGEQILQ
jgi:hypothetical protein